MPHAGAIVLLVVLAVTGISVHLGRVAFELTGLPRPKAFFQALSCFTTTGFTTLEAEEIVNHPARRRIAVVLMIMGNVGIVAFMATIVETVVADGAAQLGMDTAMVAVVCLLFLLLVRKLPPVRALDRRVRAVLMRFFQFEPDPTEQVLSYADGYGLVRAEVRAGSPVVNKRLKETHLAARQLIVLAIERDGVNYPLPGARARIHEGDRLICYGRLADADLIINGSAPLDAAAWVRKTMEVGPVPLELPEVEPASGRDVGRDAAFVESHLNILALEPDADEADESDLGHGIAIMRQALDREDEGEPSEAPPSESNAS